MSKEQHQPRRSVLSLIALCAGLFMVYLDTTVVNVALPAIRTDINATLSALQWVIDTYVLAFACLLLTAGVVGDIVGRKRVFLGAIIGFTAASVACATARDTEVLLIARTFQGIFAAAIIPISLAIVSGMFTDSRARARAIGLWAGLGGLALAIGPVLGGLFIQILGWRSVFWLNVPVGIAAFLTLAVWLPNTQTPETRRIDYPGQLLFISGTAALTFALIEGNGLGWTSPSVIWATVVGLLAISVFLAKEAHAVEPMLPLDLFRNPVFSVACFVNFFMFFGLFAVLFTMTLYLQEIARLSAFETGLRFLTLTLPIPVASYIASATTPKTGAKKLIVFGAVATTMGLLALALLPLSAGVQGYGVALAVIGVGASFSGAPASVAILASVAPRRAGTASGVWNTFRQIGAVMGVAVAGSLIGMKTGGSAAGTSFSVGLTTTLLLAAAGNGLGALAALFLMPSDPPHSPLGAADLGNQAAGALARKHPYPDDTRRELDLTKASRLSR